VSTRSGPHAGQVDADGFDTIIHAPVRLRLCATLQALGEVEFGRMLELLKISKSALSKNVATLAEAGYVGQRRAVRDTRQRVWLYLTPDGYTAYRNHVAALRAIVDPQ
jgi:DNA-binding MarR family transcriptional regulator